MGRGKKITHEEYISKVAKINQNIEVLGVYINAKTKISFKCLIDGYEWESLPLHILKGHGCPRCAGVERYTHEKYVEKISNIHFNIEVLEKYIGTHVKIKHMCKTCGHEWSVMPSSILQGKGCPKCAGVLRKTHEQYIEEVARINNNIEVIGIYVNDHTKILHRCKVSCCECEWMAIPSNILRGKGCPQCNMSHGEYKVESYLIKHNIGYIPQHKFNDCKNKRSLPFDFYLPEYNVCIEYDGKQHYEAVDWFGGEDGLRYTQQNDKIKNQYCKNNDIILLRIKYNEDVEDILNLFFNGGVK